MQTANKLIWSIIESGSGDLDFAPDYAEPGYSLGDKEGILFADWNSRGDDETMPRLAKIAERAGYEVEWSDEWSTCHHCGNAFRTSPDFYGWQQSYADVGGDILCRHCLDPAEYLESIEGRSDRANTFHDIIPSEHGYVLLKEGMKNGWHPGQNDSPQVVAKSLGAMGIDRFVFSIDGVGQFDLSFSVYVHESEAALATEAVDSEMGE